MFRILLAIGQLCYLCALDRQHLQMKLQSYIFILFMLFLPSFCLLAQSKADTLQAAQKEVSKIGNLTKDKKSKKFPFFTLRTTKKFPFLSFRQKKTTSAYLPDSLQRVRDSLQTKIDALKGNLDSLDKKKAAKEKEFLAMVLQDSLRKKVLTDTTKKPFYIPDAIRIGYDFSYFLRGLFSASGVLNATPAAGTADNAAQYSFFGDNINIELVSDISFGDNKYFLTFDAGYSDINRVKQSTINLKPVNGFRYTNTGTYFRLGLEYNLMRRFFNNEALTVGIKYAQAFFGHQLNASIVPDSLWNVTVPTLRVPPNATIQQSGLSANWVELTFGLKVNIWKNIFTGYNLRLMFLGSVYGDNTQTKRVFTFDDLNVTDVNNQPNKPFEPYSSFVGTGALVANEIPGYGNTESSFKLGFNVFAAYRFPFKHRPVVVLE